MAEVGAIEKRVNDIQIRLKKDIGETFATGETLFPAFQEVGENITLGIEVSLISIETALIKETNRLGSRAQYHILRAYWHASPSILVMIVTILSIAYKVMTIIKPIVTVIQLYFQLHIHDLVYSLWPAYSQFINSIMRKVSEFSDAVGWGVDGIAHLIHTAQAGINVLGGLMGKPTDWVRWKWGEKALQITEQMSKVALFVNDNPSYALTVFFDEFNLDYAVDAGKWWATISTSISKATLRGESALKSVSWAISELSAIQVNMPESVRKNIPSSIWSALSKADSTINSSILPQLHSLQRGLATVDNLLNTHGRNLSELAGKLGHPGDLLLGVDDLPDYAKNSQLGAIDDVTSRQFDFWSDTERTELQGDIREFERVEKLMIAPTPQPAFMGVEIPRGTTIRGITAEPHETWFIGGYNDPR